MLRKTFLDKAVFKNMANACVSNMIYGWICLKHVEIDQVSLSQSRGFIRELKRLNCP